MAYRYYNPNPAALDTDDCAVRVLCRIAGLPWTDAHQFLCDTSRDIFDMPSSDRAFGAALHALGFVRHVIPDLCPDCYTVARFAADNPSGAFVLASPGHVVAVIDGHWYDTRDCANLNITFIWAKERS